MEKVCAHLKGFQFKREKVYTFALKLQNTVDIQMFIVGNLGLASAWETH